ncbi:acetoin reductase family protein [Punctularia strigosozonata HHB-11173 SS5]|uniref:3-oxoacyl-[acyl-carrier-protein] reductase n=1 Tax=Punctularia strigosozonata (strain HHB-11173) TaxID=741275 RepID=R7S5N6_PUNST|nr:acetoin reductase family protein [Punctularia strigosozonata HHB-11173 SS5]EIN04781.1 acetoin reductase family protein [Punctularia strigosozonata HHB-11173 SS5]
MPSVKGVAIVTGAGSGIGRGIAVQLADDGFDLVVNDLVSSKDALDSLLGEITGQGRRAVAFTGDVSVEQDVIDLVKCAVDQFGGVDVMVANAGVMLTKKLVDTTVDDWDRIFSINARGVFLCYKYAAEQMIKQGRGGRLIGPCSIAGKKGSPEMAAYSATKFAIRGLTQVAAQEYGQYGITVNAYAPGAIETPLLNRVDDYNIKKTGGEKGSAIEAMKKNAALGRNGTPSDVAGLVSFLVTDKAQFITGQSILIDGGLLFD